MILTLIGPREDVKSELFLTVCIIEVGRGEGSDIYIVQGLGMHSQDWRP